MVAIQNAFTASYAEEDPSGKNMVASAPVILRAEDLHLKSGFIALTTDNA